MNLRVVARAHQFFVPLQQILFEIVGIKKRVPKEGPRKPVQRRVQRIDEQNAPFIKQSSQQLLKGFAEWGTGLIGLRNHVGDLVTERERPDGLAQPVDGWV